MRDNGLESPLQTAGEFPLVAVLNVLSTLSSN